MSGIFPKFGINVSLRTISIILLLSILLFYLVYHAMNGKDKYMQLQELQKKHEVLMKQSEELDKQIAYMKDRVDGLCEDKLDMDFVDELIRHSLGMSAPREKVIIHQAER